MAEQTFGPLGQTRDRTREVSVRCPSCSPAVTVAVLQRHGDHWRVCRLFHMAPKTAAATGGPRGGLAPLTGAGFDEPNDLRPRRGVLLHCRRCKRSWRVALRRLYELAEAAWAAGKSKAVLD